MESYILLAKNKNILALHYLFKMNFTKGLCGKIILLPNLAILLKLSNLQICPIMAFLAVLLILIIYNYFDHLVRK